MAVADDLECLYQRNTGREHRRQLAAEDRNVTRGDPGPALERFRALLPDAFGNDALAAQLGLQQIHA